MQSSVRTKTMREYSLKQKRLAVNDVLNDHHICKDVRKIILSHVKNNHTLRENKVANTNIYVFFAKNAKKAVIIRKSIIHDKRFVNMLLWNLETDEISSGQWLINKQINLRRASFSPNGEFFIYPLTVSHGPYQEYIPNGLEKLTIISRPPYFTGLGVLRSNRSVYGDVYNHMLGGKWIDDSTILINSSYTLENGSIPVWLNITSIDNYCNDLLSVQNEKTRLSKFNLKDIKNIAKNSQIPQISQLKKEELISAIIKKDRTKEVQNIATKHDHVMLTKNKQIDPIGREIWTDNGYLLVNGCVIYDFMNDEFHQVCKPQNYSWDK